MRRLFLVLQLVSLGVLWAEPDNADSDTRVVELRTAGYYELVDRARELGLPVSGSAEELRTRVAQALKIALPEGAPVSSRTLTIDSAQEAGLVDVEVPGGGKLLRLSGGLHVTLVDNEKKVTHVIEAGELWYDQANEEMTARGKVVYTMIRETSKEVFRGESLSFRLNDSQGIFYGGASDRARSVGDQSLLFRYQGEAIRRSADDLVVLDTGTITSSLGVEPYYRIQAKKIWVLAPGEWGLQDAVLYLGRIPVLYFPFFFQPGDEFFFNPTLSFPEAGDRRGTSLQTTTYLLGKKTKDTAPLSFLQLEDSSTKDSDRVIKGLFLVRGTPAKSQFPETWTLKYLADFYSNLGFLTAVDASLPGYAGTKTLTAFAGLGLTRTVDPTGVPFSANPFQAALDPASQSDWNGSWLGSTRLPFRWGGSFSVGAGWGSLSAEYYSDPLLFNDLTAGRSENFSVFSLLGLGPARKSQTAAAKSGLQWTGSSTLGPVSLAGSLLWDSKVSTPAGPAGDPENNFYAPSQLTLPQSSLNLGGTLWPPAMATNKASDVAALIPPGEGVSAGEPVPEAPTTEAELLPPSKLPARPWPDALPAWNTTATWSFKPTFKTDSRFDGTVTSPSASAWKILTSRWSGAYDGSLGWTSGWSDGSLTANQSFSLHQQLQDTWYLAPSVTQTQADIYETQDQQAASALLSQTLGSTWKPWSGGGPWRDSSLQYTLGTKLWELKAGQSRYYDSTKETVTAHQASADAGWYLWEGYGSLKLQSGLQTTLPPLDPLKTYSGSLYLVLPWGKSGTSVSAKQTSQDLIWNPWETSVEWTPLSSLSLKEVFQYDLENDWPSVSTTTLQAWGWSTQYRHQRTTPYKFDTAQKKWVVSGGQDFLPQELRFGYTLNLPTVQWWLYRNSLSSKIDFSWPLNLQQYSQMPLTLSYTVSYKLNRFLDLQMSEGIINRTAYRYFPFLTQTFGDGVVQPVNPLSDLWDSVSLWDQAALRRTGFKMTNLTVGIVHYLDDWIVRLDYSGAPQLKTVNANQQFQWSGTLALVVQWYPVPELKTQMQWDKDGTLSVLKNSP